MVAVKEIPVEKKSSHSSEAFATKDYKNMSITQLKDELWSKGLRVGGKKAELIERLQSS
jgi:hypothetical protein